MTAGPTVRDYMSGHLVSFSPETSIHDAIETLLGANISGAPVLDAAGTLVGILTTRDALRVAFSSSYHQGWGGSVSQFMSTDVRTVDASQDIVTVAGLFLEDRFHRYPVMQDGRVVGVVSRHDILAALRDLW